MTYAIVGRYIIVDESSYTYLVQINLVIYWMDIIFADVIENRYCNKVDQKCMLMQE